MFSGSKFAQPAVQSLPSAKAPAVVDTLRLAAMMFATPFHVRAVQPVTLLPLEASLKRMSMASKPLGRLLPSVLYQ